MKIMILGALAVAGSASAEDLTVKPSIDARLRYENVDQDGIARDANGLTFRVRPGVQLQSGGWSALVEGEGTVALVDDYFDGVHGPANRATIVDPENYELNRAQLRYAVDGKGAVTLGRQRIELLDQRFVGSSGFRQNEQTFDGIRAQYGGKTGFTLDLSYVWSVRTVNGIHGRGARQQAVSGDNVLALAGYGTKYGTLTGFALLIDQDEAAVQSFRLSSQTYGFRFAGSAPLGHGTSVSYAASWAKQSDFHRNPNRYSADYYLAEATLAHGPLNGTLGYEVLGADDGRPLTSFQTPLSSLFKFQGWADKFTTTPPNGIRDLYAGAGYGWKNIGRVDALTLSGTWHRFESDRLSQHYGNEMDLLGSVKFGKLLLSARYASYDAHAFATDTSKFWLSADFSY